MVSSLAVVAIAIMRLFGFHKAGDTKPTVNKHSSGMQYQAPNSCAPSNFKKSYLNDSDTILMGTSTWYARTSDDVKAQGTVFSGTTTAMSIDGEEKGRKLEDHAHSSMSSIDRDIESGRSAFEPPIAYPNEQPSRLSHRWEDVREAEIKQVRTWSGWTSWLQLLHSEHRYPY
jgi:hypothetical protein